ncbi:MAG: OmpH family outer membrane protein [Nitrospira sp.]|nr:OmpH family outer membrane protein [Nitrospira sp.]
MGRMGIINMVGALMLAVTAQAAQAGDAVKIGVMDQQAVMERSKTGKAALEHVKAYSATRQKIIDENERELEELKQALSDSNGKLSETAKQEKQEQFQSKLEAYERRLQDFNREIQQKHQDMVAEYAKKIGDAARAVAQKEGYLAVLDKGSDTLFRIVLYHQAALDVTDLIVKEFDRQNN